MQLRKVSAAHTVISKKTVAKEYGLRNETITFPQKIGNKTAFFETVQEIKMIPLKVTFKRV